MNQIPIYHLASHARAGETLTLKLLGSHSKIWVPLQISEVEDPFDRSFFEMVKTRHINFLPVDSDYAHARGLHQHMIILIKQGVWFHPQEFSGFCLVRSPFGFVQSMLDYNHQEGLDFGLKKYGTKRYQKTMARLLRWSKDMSAELTNQLHQQTCILNALCLFYNDRINQLLSYQKKIFKYEDLVYQPKNILISMCEELGIDFEPEILSAHQHYAANHVAGHGKNDLARAIDTQSIHKWHALGPRVIRKIDEQTADSQERLNYARIELG